MIHPDQNLSRALTPPRPLPAVLPRSVSTVYKAVEDASGASMVIKSYHKKKMAEKHYHKLEREVGAGGQRACSCMRLPCSWLLACTHCAQAC